MKKSLAIPATLLCATLAACSFAREPAPLADRTQDPPADARWVTLIVNAGEGLVPQPVALEYQSEKCEESRSYGVGGQSQSGTALMRAQNFEKVELVREATGNAYKARIAIDAGGPCQWKLVSLDASFRHQSRHPLVPGKEVSTLAKQFYFRSGRDAIRTPGVRVKLAYFPVIFLRDQPLPNEMRLQPLSLYLPTHLDPTGSLTLMLEPRVAADKAMVVRADPQDSRWYLMTYPDGATGRSYSRDVIGVEDERMQCLLSASAQNCERFSPRTR